MNLKQEMLAAITAAASEKPKAVTIKGFPTFYVRGRTVGEVDDQKLSGNEWIKDHTLTAAAALVICDAEGELMFNPDDPADMESIRKLFHKLPWSVVQKIIQASTEDSELVAGN